MPRNKTNSSRKFENIVIVKRNTELDELVKRFNTPAQARFYLEHAGQAFEPIEKNHNDYYKILKDLCEHIPKGFKHHIIERDFLPQYTFNEDDLIVTLGIDGLVVNTAKYLNGQAILAVNPDQENIDGVLLPYTPTTFYKALKDTIDGNTCIKKITMAKTLLNNDQELLAFNDFFVGAKTHISARYNIKQGANEEEHSSSGIIISTGAGSTGWLQSVYTGASGIISALGGHVVPPPNAGRFDWDSDWLIYSVREPFPSKTTKTSMVYGLINSENPLIVTSHMIENGVIFSDGVEQDFLPFNAGNTATISIANNKASLIVG